MRYSTSNGNVDHTFGTMDNPITASLCTPALPGSFAALSEDVVNWAVYSDENDIEGILFVTTSGTRQIYKANYNIFSPNPPIAVGGRIIGFRI